MASEQLEQNDTRGQQPAVNKNVVLVCILSCATFLLFDRLCLQLLMSMADRIMLRHIYIHIDIDILFIIHTSRQNKRVNILQYISIYIPLDKINVSTFK